VRHPLKIQKLGFGCVAGRITNAYRRWARFIKARQGGLSNGTIFSSITGILSLKTR
tara:strand:+ start:210768 stop:210935 length:168 start_codon:yes stop_codon:yes gene_type:complete